MIPNMTKIIPYLLYNGALVHGEQHGQQRSEDPRKKLFAGQAGAQQELPDC